jgi:hypothetical protein
MGKTRSRSTVEKLGQAAVMGAELTRLFANGTRDIDRGLLVLQRMIEGDLPELDPRDETFGLWTPVREYPLRLWRAARRYDWPIAPQDIDALSHAPWPYHADLMKPTSLSLWFGSAHDTYNAVVRWAMDELAASGQRPGWFSPATARDLRVNPDHGAPAPERPGATYCRPDLTRFNTGLPLIGGVEGDVEWEFDANTVRRIAQSFGLTLAGLEALVLLALNPQLAGVMESAVSNIPELKLGGLDGARDNDPESRGEWQRVPSLSRLRRPHSELSLVMEPNDHTSQSSCFPVLCDL